MLSNVKNIFKVTDLRNKILFTFMIVGLYRVGVHIRVPGVDPLAMGDLNQPIDIPSCTDAPFYVLGLSMAGWNGVISLVLAGFSFVAAAATFRGPRV